MTDTSDAQGLGGSQDTGGQQQFQQDNGGQGGEPVQPQQQQQNPFLNNVDPAHRAVVEPYLRQWDADVTRRFQDLHSQYRPYAELGAPVEDLQSAYNIYQQLNTDPKAFLGLLQEALADELSEQGPSGNNGSNQLPFQGLPEEFQTDYMQSKQALEAVAQFILEQQDQQIAQQEDQELDSYIGELRTKYGEFDEEYVIAKMYATGCSGDQAIQQWQQQLQQFINQAGGAPQRQPSGFKALSGGGSVPQGDLQKVTDLSRADTKALVASIMKNAQNQG